MTKKIRSEKELFAMLVKVNEQEKNLVKFVTETQYIDTDVKVADNYEHPHIAGTDDDGKPCFYPLYYVAKLNVNFAKDVTNVKTGSTEERKAKNAEILANATGFKAVCRDLSLLAGKTEKGFLKMTANVPCDKKYNPNGSIGNLWVFTSKELRQDFLDMVQTGINNGKYHLEKKGKTDKPLKKVLDLQKVLSSVLGKEVTYEEAFAHAVKNGIVKEK